MTRILTAVSLCAVVAAFQFSAHAGMFDPPWMGQAGTTHQEWEFPTDAMPPVVSTVTNPYGAPSATVTLGLYNSGWWDTDPVFGNTQGFWDLGKSGTIDCRIPNRQLLSEYTEVWVQVTYFIDISAAPVVTVPGAVAIPGAPAPVAVDETIGGNWFAAVSQWKITPGVKTLSVTVTSDQPFGSLIDRVQIDTLCGGKPRPIVGDINLDCKVNILDLIAVRNKLGRDPASGDNALCDVNHDGKINILDLILVRNNLGKSCP